MEIDSVKTLTVGKGDVLIVELDYGMMPPNAATRYIEQVKAKLLEVFPNNQVLILPMHKTRITVAHFADAPVSDASYEDVEFKDVP